MNFRTTISGILGALIAAVPAIQHVLAGGFGAVTQQDMALLGAFVMALVGLFHAADKQNLPK